MKNKDEHRNDERQTGQNELRNSSGLLSTSDARQNKPRLRYGASLRYKEKSKLIEKIESLPIYDGGYLVNIGHFKDWVIQIIKTGTADVLEDYVIEGGKIGRKK